MRTTPLLAAVFAVFLGSARAVAVTPSVDPELLAFFLVRTDSGTRTFVANGSEDSALKAVARAWAEKADSGKTAALSTVLSSGVTGESRLVAALSKWTGAGRIKNAAGVAAFLEDAAAKAGLVMNDPRARQQIQAAIDSGGVAPDSHDAVERARKLSQRGSRGAGVFGPDRGAGGLPNGGTGTAGTSGGSTLAQLRGAQEGGGVIPGAGTKIAGTGIPGSKSGGMMNTVAGVSASEFRPSLPASYKQASVVPPLATVEMTSSDKVINNVLSVVNMEAYSRKSTLNRESAEGTQKSICGFLIKAKYAPGAAWSLSKIARDAPGADPGDLDLRNAEHYLYAYSTTAKPEGIGDSTGVQLLLAVGWTPFKTVTKHVRSTSTPSLEEMKWGIKGAWNGQHPPDWPAICGGK